MMTEKGRKRYHRREEQKGRGREGRTKEVRRERGEKKREGEERRRGGGEGGDIKVWIRTNTPLGFQGGLQSRYHIVSS